MFFHIVLERNMQLHPRYFGLNFRDNLVSKLMKDVEGTCSGWHGFVVAVSGIENIGSCYHGQQGPKRRERAQKKLKRTRKARSMDKKPKAQISHDHAAALSTWRARALLS
ncbi:hypothetical protein PIB30_050419 [Stylosanthes scabra]|uniref:RNA polymerase Rpb7-like N-terminal domain-containing protein n=1 Tax=Stylosanthes scabra TaxID=79078 RepID=A0ABU6XJ75_9FABA|nr:hypothetical protein [Stylosanthes scabra]